MTKPKLPGSGLHDFLDGDDAPTKVTCPACNGTGAEKCEKCKGIGISDLIPEEKYGPSVYRWIACPRCRGGEVTCTLCHGTKMVSATRASGFRRRSQ